MANLDASKSVRNAAVQTVTRITLSASDTFTYSPNTNQVLELHNNTAGALTAVIKGSAPSASYPVPGASPVDLTAGLSVAVAASASKYVNLDAVAGYLAGNGTVTVTGASGMTAVLLTN